MSTKPDSQPQVDLSEFGDADLTPEIIYVLFMQLRANQLEMFYQERVVPMIEMLSKGAEFRKLYLGRVFEQWRASRIGARAKLMANPDTTTLGGDLFVEHQEFFTNRVGDEIVPFMEQMWLLHHILANVYGIPVQTLEQLDEAGAQELIELLGTTDDIISNPQTRAKVEEEAEVLRAYNAQLQQFREQTYEVIKAGAVETSTPGTTRRTIFNVVLEKLYGFDPRNREKWQEVEMLVPVFGLTIHAIRMLIEEKIVVQAIKDHRKATVIDW